MPQEYVRQDLETLKEILRRLLNRTNIVDDEDIYLAGLTSIMVLPLLAEVEETFGLSIPDDDFLNARTPRALAQLIRQLRSTFA
jgi:acyl carrier protein